MRKGQNRRDQMKRIGLVILSMLLACKVLAGEEIKYEYVSPPETQIGGVLAISALTMTIVADAKKRMGNTKKARNARHIAINLGYASLGFLSLGVLSATYYEKRFGLQTKIQF